VLVFDDPMHQSFDDPFDGEVRWQTYGFIQHTLVVVVHTDPVYDAGRLWRPGRIISARKATTRERKAFEEAL